jgi:hypothetical protein
LSGTEAPIANPGKIKEKLADERAKLVNIISN